MAQPDRGEVDMAEHVPSKKEQAFLDSVESPSYDRQLINGLRPFFNESAPEDVRAFYTKDEIDKALDRDTPRDELWKLLSKS